ncbi:hypothetical protein BDZ90DRAFT_234411 [Jaminaea rosea]|uniref:Uncharacterized protein n=1 Tax=Jaminaea rosea TaxID=1569628 RepID=A0A316UJ18_9BASI|nr:hypothetical protein BDZ90DRAFT_234411 [Jaminaea rosea]PWN25209.1 hypothetical protein BDZ90DRAFT_234411 [Jaminaea rosea]
MAMRMIRLAVRGWSQSARASMQTPSPLGRLTLHSRIELKFLCFAPAVSPRRPPHPHPHAQDCAATLGLDQEQQRSALGATLVP